MSNYPISPSTLRDGRAATPASRPARPRASTFSVADLAHPRLPATARSATPAPAYFDGARQAGQPHPDAATAQCIGLPHDPATSVPDAGQHPRQRPRARRATAQCHGAAAPTFAIPAAASASSACHSNHPDQRLLRGPATSAPGSSVPTLPVPERRALLRLGDEPRRHHRQLRGLPRAGHRPSTFAGITGIVAMPPTSPMGPGASRRAPPARAATSARWPTSAA